MTNNTKKTSFLKNFKSMFKVDVRRMFTSPLLYVLLAIAFIVPILILVMTTMMDGSVTTDRNGNETVMQGFENVWQIIGTTSSSSSGGQVGMDIVSMCNINMTFFAAAVLVCLFVSEDFKSGYCKNLFTVRAKKIDYVISKTSICFICSAGMIIAFFIGSMLGGKIAGLPFDTNGFNGFNLLFCILAKIALLPAFISVFTLTAVVAKRKTWLSICLSLGAGMLLFMMIPALTPLNSTILNVIGCLVGSVLVSVGLSVGSNAVLNKTALV